MSEAVEAALENPPEEAQDYDIAIGDVMRDTFVVVTNTATVAETLDTFEAYSPGTPMRRRSTTSTSSTRTTD